MTAGERRILTNHLVAKVSDDSLKNDKMHVSCFTSTGGFMHWTKLGIVKLIKYECVFSYVDMPEIRTPPIAQEENFSMFSTCRLNLASK